MAVVVAPRPKLRTWDRMYLPAILKGLSITLRHFFRKKVTIQFPEVKWRFPKRYRGFPKLVMGQDGIEKCVACKLCEVVCPPMAITINIGEYTNQDQRERIPAEFEIDMGRCIVCGMCEEACPKDAIVMSDQHIMSSASRESLIFKKTLLLDEYQSIETMRP
jgi:NADH-quinone oxidoreductase subunit I